VLNLLLIWIGFFLFGFLVRYLFSKKEYSIHDWEKKRVFIKQINIILSVVIVLMGLGTMVYNLLGLLGIVTGIMGILLADKKSNEILHNKERTNSKRKSSQVDKLIDETEDYF